MSYQLFPPSAMGKAWGSLLRIAQQNRWLTCGKKNQLLFIWSAAWWFFPRGYLVGVVAVLSTEIVVMMIIHAPDAGCVKKSNFHIKGKVFTDWFCPEHHRRYNCMCGCMYPRISMWGSLVCCFTLPLGWKWIVWRANCAFDCAWWRPYHLVFMSFISYYRIKFHAW